MHPDHLRLHLQGVRQLIPPPTTTCLLSYLIPCPLHTRPLPAHPPPPPPESSHVHPANQAAGNYDSSATTPACPRNGTCYNGCYWDITVRRRPPPLPPHPLTRSDSIRLCTLAPIPHPNPALCTLSRAALTLRG